MDEARVIPNWVDKEIKDFEKNSGNLDSIEEINGLFIKSMARAERFAFTCVRCGYLNGALTEFGLGEYALRLWKVCLNQ